MGMTTAVRKDSPHPLFSTIIQEEPAQTLRLLLTLGDMPFSTFQDFNSTKLNVYVSFSISGHQKTYMRAKVIVPFKENFK